MSSAGLPVSRLIDVNVNLTPQAAQYANVESLAIIGSTDVINVDERIRSYGSLEEVGADFSTTDPEYLAAELFFAQNPQPTQLYIARWAEADTAGLNIGGVLTSTQQAIATWQAISDGAFKITIDGGVEQSLTALDFSADANLNAVATTINGTLSGASIAWDGKKFTVTSGTVGVGSAVSFAAAGASGTDISAMLKLTSATGATLVDGIDAETPVECVTFLTQLTTPIYAFMFAVASLLTNDQYQAVAQHIEATATPHLFGLTTNDPNALLSANTTDIGSVLKALSLNRTCYQFSNNLYAIASLFGRMFTVDFAQQNSTITAAYKVEPDVTPAIFTSAQADSLNAKNYIYYATFDNNTSIIVNGTMASGLFFDDVQGADWLANRIQTDLYNLLYTTATKIPQTDAGVNQLINQVQASCQAGVNNGLIGPGTWGYQGFGQLKSGDFLPSGYYAYAPTVASQSTADRQARKSPPIQVACIFAGAIQSVVVTVNVQR